MGLAEDEVYLGAKALLIRRGWQLLAGQPPDGCDHLPVVEVKWAGRTGIGSKGAYKPDLLAHRLGIFLLVECKPDHSEADANKLREILRDPDRVALLFEEMTQRRLFERHGVTCHLAAFRRGLRGGLAHSGDGPPQPDLIVLLVQGMDGSGSVIPPTRPDPPVEDALGER